MIVYTTSTSRGIVCGVHDSNFIGVTIRKRVGIETTREHLWSCTDATKCHVLVKQIFALRIEVSLGKISLNGRLYSPSKMSIQDRSQV